MKTSEDRARAVLETYHELFPDKAERERQVGDLAELIENFSDACHRSGLSRMLIDALAEKDSSFQRICGACVIESLALSLEKENLCADAAVIH